MYKIITARNQKHTVELMWLQGKQDISFLNKTFFHEER